MKNYSILGVRIKVLINRFLWLLIMACCVIATVNGQAKKERTRMRLSYHNAPDNSKYLQSEVFYMGEGQVVPVTGEWVFFYRGNPDEGDVIDSVKTNDEGLAIVSFPQDHLFEVTEESLAIPIVAVFNGNNICRSADADMEITQLFMELFLTENAGIKTVCVRAYELGNDKEMFPAEGATVNFYVPRLFSDQKIGEGDLEDGRCSIEFPHEIAGDSIGNISVIARIEDDDDYGFVERKVSNFRWGNKEPIEAHKDLMTIEISIPTRGLWHSNAPLWMIITLVILLTGVWSHYLYVIFQLVKISRLKKKLPLKSAE